MQRQLMAYHPRIGYRFIPGLQTRELHEGGGFLLRTNGAGYRCRHEFEKQKKPGTFRILLFGDSYTAGMGVNDRARYGDQLEKLLPDTEVYNFGLPGSGTDMQYLSWREDAQEIEHDLVVISVMVENILRIVQTHRPYRTLEGDELLFAKPYFELGPDDSLSLRQVPVPKQARPAEEGLADSYGRFLTLRKLVNRLGPRMKDTVQRLSRFQPLPAYNRSDDPAWRLMRAILKTWTGELAKPVIIVPIPLYQYIEETASAKAYQARFRELADPPHVTIHDPLAAFQRKGPSERRALRFEHDCHLTAPAHRLLAESLASAIEPHIGNVSLAS
jgi:lysophospholipase L1-like esterase